MTRDETFTELDRRGVAKVDLDFSGGNDEGCVEGASLLNATGTVSTLEESYYRRGADKTEDDLLFEALAEPIYDQYGGFAFEGSVSGTLTWDVPARKVVMSKNESEINYVQSTVEV